MLRRLIWRLVFVASGGLRVCGRLPDEPCLIVASHFSRADTPALLAALPARRRPAVAAAAGHRSGGRWSRRWRAPLWSWLTAGFPARRDEGGLAAAPALLAAGRDVVVFVEDSRSRDGSVGPFHSGAARLAERAGAPIVPVGLHGTAALFPFYGRPHRAPVEVWIGAPAPGIDAARDAVA